MYIIFSNTTKRNYCTVERYINLNYLAYLRANLTCKALSNNNDGSFSKNGSFYLLAIFAKTFIIVVWQGRNQIHLINLKAGNKKSSKLHANKP